MRYRVNPDSPMWRALDRQAQHAALDHLGRALACAGLLAEADRIIAATGDWLDMGAAGLRREASRIALEDPCISNAPVLR